MPGLTLSFNKLGDANQRSSLFSFLDSVFSVAIFEQVSLTKLVEEVVAGENTKETRQMEYFAKPFEAFCKENLSFLTKLLHATKLATGLDFNLKQFGFFEDRTIDKYVHATEYKALVVKATANSLRFNVKFTMETDNYAGDLQAFFKVK